MHTRIMLLVIATTLIVVLPVAQHVSPQQEAAAQQAKTIQDCDESLESVEGDPCHNSGGSGNGNGGEGGPSSSSPCCGNNHMTVNDKCYSCFWIAMNIGFPIAVANAWGGVVAGLAAYFGCRAAC